jgi:hypothetical protein
MASLTVPETACNNIMAKETEDEFLAGLNPTEQPLGVDSGELFPEEHVVEEKEEEIPFHRNEKAQRYINKMVEKRLKDFKPSSEQTFKQEVGANDDKLVSALTRLVGNDTDEKRAVLADMKSALDERDERASQKAYERLQTMQVESEQQEQAELVEAVDELEEGREEIEEHYGKELTERQWNGYKEFLLDIEPKGGYQEYPDFLKTFDKFKGLNSRSNATAKSLASRGMERSSISNTEAPKGGSWKDFEAVKEQLLNK